MTYLVVFSRLRHTLTSFLYSHVPLPSPYHPMSGFSAIPQLSSAPPSAPGDAHSPRHSTSLNTPLTSATSSAHLARWQHQSHGHNTRPVRYIQHTTWATTNVVPPLRTPLPQCENGLDTNAIRMHTPCLRRPTTNGTCEQDIWRTSEPTRRTSYIQMAREGGPLGTTAHRHQAARTAESSQVCDSPSSLLLSAGSRTAIRRPARYSDTGAQSAMSRRRRRR
ncbi:hypothetical protein BJ912DRAFT_990333 [Pholiota molesta]|nr:hypothetical protein BJ912DRAFT_990333 [Pholiota molesta]